FRCGERALETRVVRVSRYGSFEELYEHEDPAAVNSLLSRVEQLSGLKELYDEDKRALGAVALEITLISEY
ncbi:hypothetical protein ADL26_11270, partial [Thermoactinomyces vulgaris]